MAIKGFTDHGGKFRAHVTLERADAQAIADEADARGVSVAEVLRDRVRGVPAANVHAVPPRRPTSKKGA